MISEQLKRSAIRRTALFSFCLSTILAVPPAMGQPAPERSQGQLAISNSLFSGERSRDVLRAQVLLDRTHFSPGVIDGFPGANTERAIKAWQKANGLNATGKIDGSLISALGGSEATSLFSSYALTKEDLAGPFGPVPSGMEAMAELDSAHFETLAEAMAEKFHMEESLLRAINPNIDDASVGTTIMVVASENPALPKVERIEVDGAQSRVRAFDADGRMVASFPATVGSSDFPSPTGSMEVRTVAPKPDYYFSPEGRSWGPDKKLTIAAGPNNPVGGTWIDLTKEGYGIHGTPDPRLIGKTASHGCVRLTNWDAAALGKAVSKGTKVVFN